MKIRDALLNGPLGFGEAPLGNMFRDIPDAEATATVDTAWDQGTRYFDTAPFYGAGLSEIRLGKELSKHKRSEYILSTKVGRLILDEVEDAGARDHGLALQRLMPAAEAKGVDIVIGGPYSSGVLVGGTHFEYGPVPKDIATKVEKIKALCAKHTVPIKAAALQFSLAHPAAAAIIPGGSRPDRIKEDHAALEEKFPPVFGTMCALRSSSRPTLRCRSTRSKEARSWRRHHPAWNWRSPPIRSGN
jgi:aryl-alcohol dehydrogenase-like predicted oxidoreductase